MPLYYINGNECHLATRNEIEIAFRGLTSIQLEYPKSKWIRITGPADPYRATVDKVYKVTSWRHNAPVFEGEHGLEVWGRIPGEEIDRLNPGWEPATAPVRTKEKTDVCTKEKRDLKNWINFLRGGPDPRVNIDPQKRDTKRRKRG